MFFRDTCTNKKPVVRYLKCQRYHVPICSTDKYNVRKLAFNVRNIEMCILYFMLLKCDKRFLKSKPGTYQS